MSRGLGHIQRTILVLIENDANGVWTLGDICREVYPGIQRVEKKHRVAVARALRKMTLPGTWRVFRMVSNEYFLCDECSLMFRILTQGRGLTTAANGCKQRAPEADWHAGPVTVSDYRKRTVKAEGGREAAWHL